jgi:hypothetical protein
VQIGHPKTRTPSRRGTVKVAFVAVELKSLSGPPRLKWSIGAVVLTTFEAVDLHPLHVLCVVVTARKLHVSWHSTGSSAADFPLSYMVFLPSYWRLRKLSAMMDHRCKWRSWHTSKKFCTH